MSTGRPAPMSARPSWCTTLVAAGWSHGVGGGRRARLIEACRTTKTGRRAWWRCHRRAALGRDRYSAATGAAPRNSTSARAVGGSASWVSNGQVGPVDDVADQALVAPS